MKQRRTEQRFMCADLVKIRIAERDRPPVQAVVNIEDISPSGACLQIEAAVHEGADIEIFCAKCPLRGKVRYCRFVGTGFDVGVQFEVPRSWDRALFEPQHLLDPRDLH